MSALLCPSSLAKPNAELFGVLDAEGKIEYLEKPITINQTFIDTAKESRAPEERFRFAATCIKGACHQWDASHSNCGLVGRIIESLNKQVEASLPACSIRDRCRWFHQDTEKACYNCNEVVRNFRIMEVYP